VNNLKRFDPNDIDETLTRVVTHGRATYLMFPYINAMGTAPKFDSISCVIEGPTATKANFAALSSLLRKPPERGEWFISFNTPWLVTPSEAENIRHRATAPRGKRD
jgi:hypothetical protein